MATQMTSEAVELAPPQQQQQLEATRSGDQEENAEEYWRGGFQWEIKGAGVEEVWAVTGDFLGPDKWVPKLVQCCELVEGEAQKAGCVRKPVLFPMGEGEPFTYALEKLLSMDPLSHSFSYTIIGGTMPGFSLMDDYVSSFKLCPAAASCTENGTLLQWSYVCRPVSTLSQEQTKGIVFALYQAAANALKDRLSLPEESITLIISELPEEIEHMEELELAAKATSN